MKRDQRVQAFIAFSRFTGMEVSAQFLRQTREHFPQAGISRIHNLAEGIYKPANDKYAFCIWSRSAAGKDQEIYPDILKPHPQGGWTMLYSAKKGNLGYAVNQSLFACMEDKVPVLTIVTSIPSGTSGGGRYKILGPAVIEHFDSSSRTFQLRGATDFVASQIGKEELSEDTLLLMIRNRLILPFQAREARTEYETVQKAREKAFRSIILDEYKCLCAVCQSKFYLRQQKSEPLIEAEAAHIIPVDHRGPDDPRNGLSLCKRHHWAFDNGLFTITDARSIKISPALLHAERKRFDLEEYDGEPIISPINEICKPDDQALHWHQQHKYRKY
ncbi:MAG: HNH endonuclease [Candidatus Aminicenantes bacterium]|nr:HNH endonuclease [Candidatus Aminicenantes bacterium]